MNDFGEIEGDIPAFKNTEDDDNHEIVQLKKLTQNLSPDFGSKIIAIGGDAVACEGLDNLAFGADVLIQCYYLAEDEITNSVLKQLAEHVIATSGQAGKIANRNSV